MAKRVHQFELDFEKTVPDSSWAMYRCVGCASSLGLTEDQVRSLPKPLAECADGRPTTLMERFYAALGGSYNCRAA